MRVLPPFAPEDTFADELSLCFIKRAATDIMIPSAALV